MEKEGPFTLQIGDDEIDKRLDIVVSDRIPNISRSRAAALVKSGDVKVGETAKKPSYKLKAGDVVRGFVPPPEPVEIVAEQTAFGVLFEDEHLIVVDKPPGLVVHPAPGHASGTLVHGLLYRCPDLKGVGGEIRPGIVHRLDKDTSGILLIAKHSVAHEKLSSQFKDRKIKKEYLALVAGQMRSSQGRIDLPIGRHPKDRKKMSVHSYSPRNAVTLWKVREQYADACLLQLDLKTGRTHQIRVHCAALHHPILGDTVYGKARSNVLKDTGGNPVAIPRHMLHAWRIEFEHPESKRRVSFQSEMPQDMKRIVDVLRCS